MKIRLEPHNPDWGRTFDSIKSELQEPIGFPTPIIEHIGSTSVAGLSAKPIIDILIGLEDESLLDKTVRPLTDKGYIYYEKYNEDMPYRRFFVKLKETGNKPALPSVIREGDDIPAYLADHQNRSAHIHVMPYNSEHWIRHIAFRDYLCAHPDVKQEYQKLKENLSLRDWVDGNDYNEGKDSFLKTEEQKAIVWAAEISGKSRKDSGACLR